jgi:serine/threonine-protein kinase
MFPQIFGKFVLEREIAAGGMARVYLATLRGAGGFEKKLVVKQIRPELASDEAFVGRFVEEAKTAVELGHPNIVPVYELGVEQGVYYIAMEYCEGATLAEILAETGPLDPEEGAYVGVEVCRALDYAHRRAGIVHRDVTPRNVLIDGEGAVRLIDFGIAAPGARGEDGPVSAREVFGSPGHMPPEQLAGRRLSPATDVFAVAAALVEAWTARAPFRRATPADSERALAQPLPALTEHDARLAPLDELVASALALDAAKRPSRAEDLARPLRDFLKGADLGDLARRLGARASRARERARVSKPPGEASDAQTASQPTGQTRTFAARNELMDWTQPVDDAARPDVQNGAPETRRLDAEERSRLESKAPSAAAVARHNQRAASGWRLVAAALAGMVVAALVSVRLMDRPAPEQRAAPSTEPSRPVIPAPAILPAVAPALPAAKPAEAPEPARTAATAAVRARQPAPELGTLSLTANPAARVRIAGISYHTPASVQLRAGRHLVVFESPQLGESASTEVTVHAGASQRLHADFTGARPSVSAR